MEPVVAEAPEDLAVASIVPAGLRNCWIAGRQMDVGAAGTYTAESGTISVSNAG